MNRTTRDYTYLGSVQGMCRACRALVPCRIMERDGVVYQERLCPSCPPSRTRIADSVEWYLKAIQIPTRCHGPKVSMTAVRRGCPWDCGPCHFHANACHLPVFSVTNVCNMGCPICFTYNRSDRPYFMTRAALHELLDRLLERSSPLDLVNITGGEPTLHPNILSLIEECRRPEIGRVTMNSNGLRLARDAALCRELAARDAYTILSFSTFRPETSVRMHGQDVVREKRQALENLQKANVGTTLLNVMGRGVNEDEIGGIIDLARQHPVVRSVTVQTMTYTGQGGKDFTPRSPLPIDGAMAAIENATAGEMRRQHFFPHPGAHPLCYHVAYYLRMDGRFRSLTDLLPVDSLRRMLEGGYLIHMTAGGEDELRTALDRLWADGGDTALIRHLKHLMTTLYPSGKAVSNFERQRLAEENILAVYLHAHMDEDTLDLARLVVCPDQVPDEEGRLIPACAYNIFYRMQDERFYDSR